MGVASALAVTLAASCSFAAVVVQAPLVGLANRPHASLVVALCATVLAASVVVIQVALLLTFAGAVWPAILTDYLLAMGHNVMGGVYPFFWSPPWVFRVGSLTPLIPAGAALALFAGYSARVYARRTAVATVFLAFCLLFAYAAAGAYASYATWGGIPV